MYRKDVKKVLSELRSSYNGLSQSDALNRLDIYGKNELVEDNKISKLEIFFNEFNDPMIIILIICAFISFIVSIINKESFIDSIIIIAIVILNAFIGFFQEEKADKALESLKKMQVNKAKVKRDGKIVVIDSKDVVVGDILILEAGDFVCADARIIKASSLKVDESALTGESIQIDKDFKKLNDDLALSERTNMVYMGTNVTYGHGEAVVCNTGMSTEFGKIAEMLKDEDKELTPLQKKIEEISRVLSFIIMVIIVIMFFIGLFKGMKILEILMLSLSLAVAAIPEGLPAIITITLSLGIYRMAHYQLLHLLLKMKILI